MIHLLGMMMLVLIICLQARASLGRRVQKSQEMLAALEASQNELRKFYRAVEQNPESIVITDPELKVIYVNEAFLLRSGYAREQVIGQSTELVSTMGMDRSHRQRALKQLAKGTLWRGEMTNRTSKGEALRESVLVTPIRTPQGEVVNYVELKRDLSERVLAERRIHDLVYLDSLTGLPNRHSLTLHLRELALVRQDASHGLLLLDVDRFSVFNDVHGMQHSDELVQAMGARLVEVLPDDAWIARIAAAEFAIVFDSLHKHAQGVEEQLQQYAQTLKKALQKPFSSTAGWKPSLSAAASVVRCWSRPSKAATAMTCCALPAWPCMRPSWAVRAAWCCSSRAWPRMCIGACALPGICTTASPRGAASVSAEPDRCARSLCGCRGAGALAASGMGAGQPGRVHSGGRGVRAHRASGRLGAASGLHAAGQTGHGRARTASVGQRQRPAICA
jgi:PAS domain S-box-containing protein/diguanylate cyclase (GGDEF)-like protein